MKIDTDFATDATMAECLAECLAWLSSKGRDGAKLLASIIDADPDFNLEEAASWIADIDAGKEL